MALPVKFRAVTKEDKVLIHSICYGCRSDSMKNTYAYIPKIAWLSKGKRCFYETDGESCFFFAYEGKDHVRLIAFAVSACRQHNGVGTQMLFRLKTIARNLGKTKITFRTSMDEDAINWWLRNRAVVIGKKDHDFCLEMYV